MNKSELLEVGNRMSEIRRSRNVTQEGLAEIMEVSPHHVSHIENGVSQFSLNYLLRFCDYFDCSLDYIIYGNKGNSILAKLPDKIVAVLDHGAKKDQAILLQYLNIFLEIGNNS